MRTRLVAVGVLLAVFTAFAARGGDAAPAPGVPQGIHLGYRGLTIPVSGDQAVFLKKGDLVDVMVTFDAKMKGNIREKLTTTILQKVYVLDVRVGRLEEKAAVRLMVNPEEAQYLALSLVQGTVHIAVRGAGDKEMHPMEMAAFRKLFS